MNINKSAFIFLVIISGISLNCSNDPISTGNQNLAISGQVVDAQGQPVSNAGIHYIFELLPKSQLPKSNNICPSTSITFNVPYAGHVSLKIYRWYTEELIATLVDTTLSAGHYNSVFDGSDLTSGVYLSRLICDTILTEHKMVLQVLDYNHLANTKPLMQTDGSGKFILPYAELGFDLPIQSTTSNGEITDTVYISRAISLVIVKTGYQTLIEPMMVDLSNETRKTFILQK